MGLNAIVSNNLNYQMKLDMEKTKICNICNGTEFTTGPLGRLSSSGEKPCCIGCGSLERHRIIRTVWKLIPFDFLGQKKALQFSLDPSAEPKWFLEHEVSIYGNKNSLDLQKIDREDGAYDIVICNQILEHVADDKAAFSELLRIMKNDGFLQMTVPLPISRKVTEDWGYPKEDFHGHYRHYGIDLIEYFKQVYPEVSMINVRAHDQVTNTEDFVFFWMKDKKTRDFLLDCFNGKIKIEQFF